MANLESILAGLKIMTPEEEAEYQREQRESERRRIAQDRALALKDSEIPITDEMRTAVVRDELKDTHALTAVRQWRESWQQPDSPAVLVLAGPPGIGKGVAAAWAIARAHRPVYLKARSLVAYHSASFGEERQRYEQAVRTELLVIDELGTEQRDAKAALQDVIDDRIGGKRRTMVIGNMTKAQLIERIDERTVDRLRAIGVVVELRGKSLRAGKL